MDSETRGGRRKPPFWTAAEMHWIDFMNGVIYDKCARGRWSFLQWIRSGRGRF